MQESVCIFLEQNYLPKRYKENIENFFFILKENYRVDIFSPEIDMNSNYNHNLIKILHNNKMCVKTSAWFKSYYDILIIFSDYNKKLTFDRRILIIKAITHKKLITISGYKPFVFNSIKKANNLNLMDNYFYDTTKYENKIIFESIFSKIISFSLDEKIKFLKKYKINKNLIALIPGPIQNWKNNICLPNIIEQNNRKFTEIFLENIEQIKEKLFSEGYEILGIRYFKDNYSLYNDINIKWVDESEYNILKYCSSAIISMSNDNFFRYFNINKPLINIGIIPYIFLSESKSSLYNYLLKNLNFFYKENNYYELDNIDYGEFILNQINSFKSKDNELEKLDILDKIKSIENNSNGILINNRI